MPIIGFGAIRLGSSSTRRSADGSETLTKKVAPKFQDNMPLPEQVRVLGDFLLEHYADRIGEEGSEGGIECVMRLLVATDTELDTAKAELAAIDTAWSEVRLPLAFELTRRAPHLTAVLSQLKNTGHVRTPRKETT
jgi:hypothetical protein